MNRILQRIVDALNSETAEYVYDIGDFVFPFVGMVANVYALVTQPSNPLFWVSIPICLYFGVKGLENLLYIGIDEENIPFGEEIYHSEDD